MAPKKAQKRGAKNVNSTSSKTKVKKNVNDDFISFPECRTCSPPIIDILDDSNSSDFKTVRPTRPRKKTTKKNDVLVIELSDSSQETIVSSSASKIKETFDISDLGVLSDFEKEKTELETDVIEKRSSPKLFFDLSNSDASFSASQINEAFNMSDLEDSSDSEKKELKTVDADIDLIMKGVTPKKKALSSDDEEEEYHIFRHKKPVTRRGIAMSTEIEVNDDILPQAAIFSSSVARYREAMKNSDQKIKEMQQEMLEKEEKEKLSKNKKKKDDSFENSDESSGDVEVKNKKAIVRKNYKKVRDRTQRLFDTVLKREDFDDDDDEGGVLEMNEEDDEICIKIRCLQEILRIPMKKGEQFSKVFSEVAQKLDTNISEVALFLRDHAILLEDTPLKLDIKASDILKCDLKVALFERMDQSSFITIYFQSNKSRRRSSHKIHKLEAFSNVMMKYAQELGLPLQNLKFDFDGEQIDPNHNSIELELEDGSVVDVYVLE